MVVELREEEEGDTEEEEIEGTVQEEDKGMVIHHRYSNSNSNNMERMEECPLKLKLRITVPLLLLQFRQFLLLPLRLKCSYRVVCNRDLYLRVFLRNRERVRRIRLRKRLERWLLVNYSM